MLKAKASAHCNCVSHQAMSGQGDCSEALSCESDYCVAVGLVEEIE